ncbi:MAG: ASCH domain-containing protein [Polymorphobacter sp.]|uniref:ASCH domain-containing protein n=1 Tax=Polymorphobacter sp. TaxID=1909290 RepID=UPI003A837E5C
MADNPDPDKLPHFAFGDTAQMADELLALVRAGTKTATCWAAVHGQRAAVGMQAVITDSRGRPGAQIEITALECVPFLEVGAAHAHDEGAGDQSLAFWRAYHEAWFRRAGVFRRDMGVWCARFRVVALL